MAEADLDIIRDAPDVIDFTVFEQILEMDDDPDDRDFSKQLVFDFFDQADGTFRQMDDASKAKDLNSLSSLGHFLKGSSATLGLSKVQSSCEKIQNYGKTMDALGDNPLPGGHDEALRLCGKSIQEAKVYFSEAKKILQKFFHDES